VYSEVEEAAKVARVGLWVDSNPIEPWNFRKKKGTLSN
jgi:endonuclease YncB( thermonuclease family)